jgi:AAHS family 4-hydroxybenzoate transporter-like MFS transporter
VAGDRIGRRRALLGSVAPFGLMTLVISTVHDMTTLAVLRFLAGVGLGGALPNAATMAAEFVPPAHRPMAVTATIVCVPLGGMLAGILGSQLLATAGWRVLFAMCGVAPLVVAAVLTRLLPESPDYLERVKGRQPARHSFSLLVAPEYRRDTIALWFSFASCLLAVYLGFSWLPTVLAGAGFDASVASNGITAFNLGGVAGALASGAIMSRIGSRAAMLTMNAGAILGALVLSAMTISVEAPLAPIMVMLTITGGLINAIQTTMYALAANVYPGAVRASGVGAATAVGRTGAIVSGYAGPWALALRGSSSYFALIACAMVVCFVALAAVRRHVARPAARA